MKCLILLVACCGIALANNAAYFCLGTSSRMKGAREFTSVQITVSMLWKVRQIGEQLNKNHDLENSVRGREITIRHSTVARHLLHIFDHQINKKRRHVFIYPRFQSMIEAITKVDNAATNFLNNVDQFCKDENEQPNETVEKLYTEIYNAMVPLLPNDLTYKLKAIESYNKLSSNMDEIVEILKKSTFGTGILSFVAEYRAILEQIKVLLDSPLNITTVSKNGSNSGAFALQLVIVEVIDIYAVENLCSTFLLITSDLEELDAATIESLSLPEESIAATCALLRDSIDELKEFIADITSDLNALSFQTVFAKIFPLGKNRLTIYNQLNKILKALKMPKRDADAHVGSDEIVSALEQFPVYDIRYDYKNTIAEIVKIFSENWHPVFILLRNIWLDFADNLVKVFKKSLHNDILLFISDSVLKVQFWTMTNYLAKRSTITENHLKFKFDGLIYFEQSLTDFVNLANGLTAENLNEEKPKMIAQAKIVFANIQSVLYQLTTAIPYSIRELDESVSRINGLSAELNKSNQSIQSNQSNQPNQSTQIDPQLDFKNSIGPLVGIFEEISVKFQCLVNMNKKLSTEFGKNRSKFAIVNSATFLTVGAYNYVYVIDAFLYIVDVFKQLKKDDKVGVIYPKDIDDTVTFIRKYVAGLASVIAQVEQMCGENDLVHEDIVDQLKKISMLLYDHSDVCRRVNNRIVNIIVALPRPSWNETALYNAYMKLMPIFLLPMIETEHDYEGIDEEHGSDRTSFYADAIRRIQSRIKSWTETVYNNPQENEIAGEVYEEEITESTVKETEEAREEAEEEAVEEAVEEAEVETGQVEPVQEECVARIVDAEFEGEVAGGLQGIFQRGVNGGVRQTIERGVAEEEEDKKTAWKVVRNFFQQMCC